jgi:hypothetical protein
MPLLIPQKSYLIMANKTALPFHVPSLLALLKGKWVSGKAYARNIEFLDSERGGLTRTAYQSAKLAGLHDVITAATAHRAEHAKKQAPAARLAKTLAPTNSLSEIHDFFTTYVKDGCPVASKTYNWEMDEENYLLTNDDSEGGFVLTAKVVLADENTLVVTANQTTTTVNLPASVAQIELALGLE